MIYYSNYDLNDENVKLYTDKIKISLRTGGYPKSTFGLRINDENVLSKDFSFIGRIEEDGTRVVIKGKETFVIDKNANIIFSSRYKWISRKEADGIRRFSLEDRFGLLDEKFNIKYIIKEKSGWLGFKDQDDNRILIKLKTKLKLRDFFPTTDLLTLGIYAGKETLNNLTKATKESDVYKYKLSKEYYKGIRSGTVVPYFNYYDQTENIENNHHLMYSSIHQEYPKGSINTVCNLVDNDGEVVLKQDYDLISHVIDGYRYLFRKKKKFSFNIITNEIKELIDSKNIK